MDAVARSVPPGSGGRATCFCVITGFVRVRTCPSVTPGPVLASDLLSNYKRTGLALGPVLRKTENRSWTETCKKVVDWTLHPVTVGVK